jgi:hypothetical protein
MTTEVMLRRLLKSVTQRLSKRPTQDLLNSTMQHFPDLCFGNIYLNTETIEVQSLEVKGVLGVLGKLF